MRGAIQDKDGCQERQPRSSWLGNALDSAVLSGTESAKMLSRELFRIGLQITDATSATILHFFHEPNYYRKRMAQRKAQARAKRANVSFSGHSRHGRKRNRSILSIFGWFTYTFLLWVSFVQSLVTLVAAKSLPRLGLGNFLVNLKTKIGAAFSAYMPAKRPKNSSRHTRQASILASHSSAGEQSETELEFFASARNGTDQTGHSMQRVPSEPSLEYLAAGDSNFQPTTGYLEDFQIRVLLALDCMGWVIRSIVRGLFGMPSLERPRLQRQQPVRAGFSKYDPAQPLSSGEAKEMEGPLAPPGERCLRGLDVESIVRRAGYPYESHTVETEDGYILQVDRIPRRGRHRVMFLQHGILDTSHAWVSGGAAVGLGFRAFDKGYDVWMGNFRGTGNRLHVRGTKRSETAKYWKFTLDDHGALDMRAMIDTVFIVKSQEHGERDRFSSISDASDWSSGQSEAEDADKPGKIYPTNRHKALSKSKAGSKLPLPSVPPDITLVAHSMGGAGAMIYLANSYLEANPHRISRAVLLSPAGYHTQVPLFCRMTGPIINATLANWIPAFCVPHGTAQAIMAKFVADMLSLPALKDLFSFLIAGVIGGTVSSHPASSPRVAHNSLTSGTSSQVFKQFWANFRSGSFKGFDYGSGLHNKRVWGATSPPDYLKVLESNLDIPLHFVGGSGDTLIASADIKAVHNRLAIRSPHLVSFKNWTGRAHIDFTYGLDTEMADDVFKHGGLVGAARKLRRNGLAKSTKKGGPISIKYHSSSK